MADGIGAKEAWKSKRAFTEIFILEEEAVLAGSMNNTAYLPQFRASIQGLTDIKLVCDYRTKTAFLQIPI